MMKWSFNDRQYSYQQAIHHKNTNSIPENQIYLFAVQNLYKAKTNRSFINSKFYFYFSG